METELKKSPIIQIVVAVALIGLVFWYTNQKKATSNPEITGEATVGNALKFINEKILQNQATSSLISFAEEGNVYKFKVKIGNQEYESFVTKDGKYFFPEGYDLIATTTESQTENKVVNVPIEGEPVLGEADAPVTLIEFSDFECPYCAKFTLETLPQIKKDYIDTGKVKMVFKHFPIHSGSQKAAEASECAFEQGKFWEYSDKLFANQSKLTVDDLKKYAKDLSLDSQKFDQCLDSGKFTAEVEANAVDAQNAGIDGTPMFFANGELISGAVPYSYFQQIIDSKLSSQ